MKSNRLLSLDILRGITVAGMILVNNGWGESFEMLQHSRWNGMTPCDLVFPFFLFIMGIACYLSMVKTDFRPTVAVLRRIVKRTVLLFLIGLFIHWLDGALEGDYGLAHLRIMAVLQRIALCYLVVSLFAVYCSHCYTLPVAVGLLAVYTAILLLGNGYAEDAATNVLAQFDLRILGYDHIYHKSPVDPEGLLGTIPSIAHVLLGFYCGRLIRERETVEQKVIAVFVLGAVLVIGGYLLSYGLLLNKRIWSPSYVLMTCGLASLLQALLINEELRMKNEEFATALPASNAGKPTLAAGKPTSAAANPTSAAGKPTSAAANSSFFILHSSFFKVFGVNALALYVSSELLAILLGHFGISETIYNGIHTLIPADKWASLAYAVYFVMLNFALGYVLYRKKIFIKL